MKPALYSAPEITKLHWPSSQNVIPKATPPSAPSYKTTCRYATFVLACTTTLHNQPETSSKLNQLTQKPTTVSQQRCKAVITSWPRSSTPCFRLHPGTQHQNPPIHKPCRCLSTCTHARYSFRNYSGKRTNLRKSYASTLQRLASALFPRLQVISTLQLPLKI